MGLPEKKKWHFGRNVHRVKKIGPNSSAVASFAAERLRVCLEARKKDTNPSPPFSSFSFPPGGRGARIARSSRRACRFHFLVRVMGKSTMPHAHTDCRGDIVTELSGPVAGPGEGESYLSQYMVGGSWIHSPAARLCTFRVIRQMGARALGREREGGGRRQAKACDGTLRLGGFDCRWFS